MPIDTGIGETERGRVADALKSVLADTYTLYLKTHGYHWNVTGPQFHTLHTMFEQHYTEMWQAVDEVAERIRALGDFAPAGYRQFAELTKIADGDNAVPDSDAMIRHLVEGHETLIKTARAALKIAADAEDPATEDLLTVRIQLHEKTAWMLRSLLGE